MKIFTILLTLISICAAAQIDERDIEAKKLFLNLQAGDKIRDMWLRKVSKSFEQDEKTWKEEYTEPQIIKNAIIDSLYTIPEEKIAEGFYSFFKDSYSLDELKLLNNYLSNEVLQRFFLKSYEFLNMIEGSTSSQIDTGLFNGIVHEVLRKNEKYKRKH